MLGLMRLNFLSVANILGTTAYEYPARLPMHEQLSTKQHDGG